MMDSVADASGIDALMIDDILENGAEPGGRFSSSAATRSACRRRTICRRAAAPCIVAESHGHFAQKLAANDRWYLVARTIQKNVRRFKNVQDIEIDLTTGVRAGHATGARSRLPGIDTIVFAGERRSDRSIAEIAKSRGLETYVIGDAADVSTEDSGTILPTIAQAYDRARAI